MYYETTFIVNPDISQEKTQELTDQLVAKVEKAGGRIVKREYWGVRPLAYPIEKRKRGHYTLLVTDGEAVAIQALESAIQLEERILRFLTVRLNELSDEPSPLMRRRRSRSEEKSAEAEGESAQNDSAAETEDGSTESDSAVETDADAGEAAEA